MSKKQTPNVGVTADGVQALSFVHILIKLRWSRGGGFVDAVPIEAFTARKKANTARNKKNKKSTACEYVVKSVKLS